MRTPFSQLSAEADEPAGLIFFQALKMNPEQRGAFLEKECGPDPGLRAEVEAMLRDYEDAGSLLSVDSAARSGFDEEMALLNPEEAGEHIGPYKLLQQIGEGGCGVVWMAEQEMPVRRRVALKVIKLGMDTKQVIARFEAERQALALMDHPNIARVLEAGATETGRPYFVMELVRGIRITTYCDQNNLPTERRLALFTQVCQAVQHAHQKGIIHRDIKPSNILVTLHDGVPVPKVIDFGIAKATTGQLLTDKTIFTAFEQFIGTPAYMSPEQAEMSGLDIDTRSDIYSLGVLLYELLTSQTPFDAKELLASGLDAMRRTIREQEPPRPSTRLSTMLAADATTVARHHQTESARLTHSLRGDLDWIVMKALEKDRTRRYENASGLALDIQRHLDNEPVTARPPGNLYRFQKFVQRNKLTFAAASAVFTALILGLGFSAWMFFKERDSRERAAAAEQEQGRLRRMAEVQEKKATDESSKSQQVAQFLNDMLEGVRPSVALGRDTALLKEILDRTANRVGAELQRQPEVEAELRGIIGLTYYGLGEFEKATAMHSEALAIRRKLFGDEHPKVANSLDNLARSLTEQGKPVEAEPMLRQALEMRRKRLGNEDAVVGTSLVSLAIALGEQGKYAEAEAMNREALAIEKRVHHDENEGVCMALEGLAQTLSLQDKDTEAETVFREDLAMRRKLSGHEHPIVCGVLNNLALSLHGQGKYVEAESLLREALAMKTKFLGAGHPRLADTVSNLALALSDQNKLTEAETLDREALAMRKKAFGNEHPRVADSLNNLAMVLEKQGNLAEAETIRREEVAIRRKLIGAGQPHLASALENLADTIGKQEKQEDLDEVVNIYREALAIKRKSLGSGHVDVATTLNNVGIILGVGKRLAEAESSFREALSIRTKILEKDHPDRVQSLQYLHQALVDQGKQTEAEQIWGELLTIIREAPASRRQQLEGAMLDLADTFYRRGDYGAAEPLYRELVENQRARLPAENEDLLLHTASLARMLTDWAWSERSQRSEFRNAKPEIVERAREAERLLRDCLAIRRSGPNAIHWRTDDVRSRLGAALVAEVATDATLTADVRLERLTEAESLLNDSNEALQRGEKVDLKYKRDSLTRLVRLYQAWDKPKKAAAWQHKLDDLNKAEARPEAGEKHITSGK